MQILRATFLKRQILRSKGDKKKFVTIHVTLHATNMKQTFYSRKSRMLLVHQTHELLLLEHPIYSMSRYCLKRTFQTVPSNNHALIRSFLRFGMQKTPYQKTYELQAGTQQFTVDFKGYDKQLDWFKISLLYNKSDKHLTIYDRYNAECAA